MFVCVFVDRREISRNVLQPDILQAQKGESQDTDKALSALLGELRLKCMIVIDQPDRWWAST
jgi:hypothetical protein